MRVEPLVEKIAGVTNAGTAVTLDSQPVPPGEVWEIDFVCFLNSSGEAVSVTVAVYDGVRTIGFLQNATLADKAPLATNICPTLGEEDRLRATVTGTANKSDVRLYFTGKRITLGE